MNTKIQVLNGEELENISGGVKIEEDDAIHLGFINGLRAPVGFARNCFRNHDGDYTSLKKFVKDPGYYFGIGTTITACLLLVSGACFGIYKGAKYGYKKIKNYMGK